MNSPSKVLLKCRGVWQIFEVNALASPHITPIYLDYNATTPILPEAWEAMRPVMAEAFGNPSSAHQMGRRARQFLEDARDKVAALLGADSDEVVFTSGATEANNLAILGLHLGVDSPHILASRIEHPCVIEPLRQLANQGVAVKWLPVSERGIVETATVVARVTPNTRLICLMLVNHETGAIQPVRHVAKKFHKELFIHCDAAQAVGKIPVNFHDLSVTTLSASAHKFRGPKGVGVLLLKRGTKCQPRFFGGHQQKGLRPGTEAVALAVGMATALEVAVRDMAGNLAKLEELRTRFVTKLLEAIPNIVLNSPEATEETPPPNPLPDAERGNGLAPLPDAERGRGWGCSLPTTVNLSFLGCRSDVLLVSLDLAGIACSTGSACSSGSLLPSPVLEAMGVSEERLRSAIRFSLSPMLTEQEIHDAADRIIKCVQAVRQQSNKEFSPQRH